MTRDPMCARITAGKRVVQETVLAALDGSMANVFVHLTGSFPEAPVPTEPVTIDQRGCIYTPRVVGVRVGQVLQVRNSDNLLHNVHALSGRGQGFNVGQPLAGMVNKFPLKQETMLKLSCGVHVDAGVSAWCTLFHGHGKWRDIRDCQCPCGKPDHPGVARAVRPAREDRAGEAWWRDER
jgi:plastocyanin